MDLKRAVSTPIAILIIVGCSLLVGFLVVQYRSMENLELPEAIEVAEEKSEEEKPEGMMILIEYESMDGLSNMVNELQERNIHALLHVGPGFVEENCEGIKKLTDYNVSIVGGCGDPLWDLSYKEQKEVISETKERIENCTGEPLEFVTSRYWGWDENTVKVAEELGIDNIFARGLVGNGAAIFQPEGYEVKILSVSNIEAIEYKYGSVCDYSFWVRDGEPSEMLAELDDALSKNDKITPVSHTNIGGLKKDWLSMWLDFFDSGEVDWVSWREFSEVDYEMPLERIPMNKNVPYTPEMRESVDEKHEQGENVENPCTVEDLPAAMPSEGDGSRPEENEEKIVMFHNNKGSMCLEALSFFEEQSYPVEEHLTTESDFSEELQSYKSNYEESEGVSTSFGYYPIIFVGEKAYSGFNEEVKEKIMEIMQ